MPFGAVKGGQSHENNQYWNSCPCRRWKDDLDGEPAICQRSHFRTGERRKRDNEDGHHVFERQRGITIQAAVTSFQWHRCKVNIVDTPGHMDFLAEVYRSLAVLDGAILVISAKDGVQAQTRILFHALRKMNIPTVIFINKIDQAGVDLQSVVQSVRDKLSADIIIKQTVSLSPEIVLEENTDIEAWMRSSKITINYWKSISQENQSAGKNLCGRNSGGFKTPPCSRSIMAAQKGPWHSTVDGCGDRAVPTDWGTGERRPMRQRFQGGVYRLRPAACLSTAIQRNAAPAGYGGPGRERKAENHRDAYSIQRGNCSDRHRLSGVKLLSFQRQREVKRCIRGPNRLPRKRWREDPLPMLRTSIAPKTAAQRERLLDALTQLADTDPLLRCEVDSITHEIILSFLGRVQLEVVSALLSENTSLKQW